MDSGVYYIMNKETKAKYIGSAKNFKSRFQIHLSDLKLNKHHSIVLQRAYNKYGAESFSFEKIAFCPPEYLIRLEQWFLDTQKPEYNICKIAGSRLGLKCSDSHKLKVSLAKKGLPCPNHLKPVHRQNAIVRKSYLAPTEANKVKVAQYDINGVFLDIYPSVKEAAIKNNCAAQSISSCCVLKRKTANGYQWRYYKENTLLKVEPVKFRSNRITKKTVRCISGHY